MIGVIVGMMVFVSGVYAGMITMAMLSISKSEDSDYAIQAMKEIGRSR